jgi:hypothetical protein
MTLTARGPVPAPESRQAESRQRAVTTRRPELRVAVVGVSLVAVGYLAVAVFAAVTLPWRGTADAFDHLDYIYQLLHGHLPAPFGHEWVPADRPGPSPVTRQWVAQHPPLFYLLAAPLAAPSLEADWTDAVALIRGANILVGVVGVVVLGWLGWMTGGRWRTRLAIALPAAGAATFAYVRYSAEVYNDALLTTLSVLAVALTVRMVLRGITALSLLLLSVVCILGFGTKATFVLTLVVAVVGVFLAALRHSDRPLGRRLLRASGAAAVVLLPAVLAWGWFYARNAALSGSWYEAIPGDVQVLDRTYRSTADVLTGPTIYVLVPKDLVGGATNHGFQAIASSAVFAVAAALTVVVLVRRVRAGSFPSRSAWLVAGLLAAHLAGSYLIQLAHASGYGNTNWRYFLPSTATVAVLLGLGVASLGRASSITLPGLVVVMGALNVRQFLMYGIEHAPVAVGPRDVLGVARALAAQNGWPELLPALCLAVALAAAGGLGILVARNRRLFAVTDAGPPRAA